MPEYFDTPIEFLKGVGPQKADLLKKELKIFTYGDLISYYPFRHEDRTKFHAIGEVDETLSHVQMKGQLFNISAPTGRGGRLKAILRDGTGEIELVWFKGVEWVRRLLKPNVEYMVFGRPTVFGSKLNIVHPELEPATGAESLHGLIVPVYNTTEMLKRRYLGSQAIAKLQYALLRQALPHIHENLPDRLCGDDGLMSRAEAIANIHFPKDGQSLALATRRLKFEELFFIQLRAIRSKLTQKRAFEGQVFSKASLLTEFYDNHLAFELTGAQKRVIREIYADMRSGQQMNRLLQGDVGSGKTIVAFICMLLAIDGGSQCCLMAPTEILADQHYRGLNELGQKMGLNIRKLSGSTPKRERREIHAALESGEINFLVGTHALLEDPVKYRNLGLCVIDEQHRFGVAQRARLWKKNERVHPHILVMTATPIPRTLAMTVYGDLDLSVIDELPAGRKPIKTVHRRDANRLRVFGFMKEQIAQGRQVYIVYPLIEESETLHYKDLMDGFESIQRAFPLPQYAVSILHGRMKPADKDFEMQRFVKGETQIMVATTVIEVGVNVPNATVMVIENSEKFGLAQLHQLRGRVGRGADQSYCILMTDVKVSKEAKQRIEAMVRTNNGFEIADIDLKLRGPGDLMGTQQSGLVGLHLADLSTDGALVKESRVAAETLIETDPDLTLAENANLRRHLQHIKATTVNWSRIS